MQPLGDFRWSAVGANRVAIPAHVSARDGHLIDEAEEAARHIGHGNLADSVCEHDLEGSAKVPSVRTLMRWRREVLANFACWLTNARTEGFNGKAKLVIRRAYGYKSFRNYRLLLLSCCA